MPGDRTVPRVSVIVPVRNRATLLSGTLEALRAQTCTEHEVLVVEDLLVLATADERGSRPRTEVDLDDLVIGQLQARRTTSTGTSTTGQSLAKHAMASTAPPPY